MPEGETKGRETPEGRPEGDSPKGENKKRPGGERPGGDQRGRTEGDTTEKGLRRAPPAEKQRENSGVSGQY